MAFAVWSPRDLEDLIEQYATDMEDLRRVWVSSNAEIEGASIPVPEDIWLLRFLKDSTLPKMVPRVKCMLEWRRDNKVNEPLSELR